MERVLDEIDRRSVAHLSLTTYVHYFTELRLHPLSLVYAGSNKEGISLNGLETIPRP